MSTDSPPAASKAPDIDLLVEEWTPARAWHWLRANPFGPEDQPILHRLAERALKDLGITGQALTWNWQQRPPEKLADPSLIPLVRLPLSHQEPWPEEAAPIAETPVGVLAALVASGWNAFEPFLPFPMPTPQKGITTRGIRETWGVEIILGHIDPSKLPDQWRLALIDQMLRSPYRPTIHVLRRRKVGKRGNGDKPRQHWLSTAIKSNQAVSARILADRGIHFGVNASWPPKISEERRAWWEACFLNSKSQPKTSLAPKAPPRRI